MLGRLSRLQCDEPSPGLSQVLLPPPFIAQLGGLSAAVPLAELLLGGRREDKSEVCAPVRLFLVLCSKNRPKRQCS